MDFKNELTNWKSKKVNKIFISVHFTIKFSKKIIPGKAEALFKIMNGEDVLDLETEFFQDTATGDESSDEEKVGDEEDNGSSLIDRFKKIF